MYTLYGGKYTRAMLVQMVMAEGEIEYELINVDMSKKEQLSESYLKLNPAGWIPVLITPDGEKLYETSAINLYLIEKHRLSELAPLDTDLQRGLFLSGLFYISNELEPTLKRYWYSHRYANGETDAPAVKQKASQYCLHCLEVINQRLQENGPFHLGDRFSLVDLMVTYWAVSLEEQDSLDGLHHLQNMIKRVIERPKLSALMNSHIQLFDEFYD